MTEQNDVVSAPDSAEKSADQILKEIEAAQGQLDQENAKSQIEPAVTSKSDSDDSIASDKQDQSGQTSEGQEDTVTPDGSDKGEVDEWMKKKGIKSNKDLARYLRNFEREFHKGRKEAKEAEIKQFQPQPAPQARPPAYPSQAPTMSMSIDEVAQAYGVLPEDLKRMLPIVNDASDLKVRQALQPVMEEFTTLKRELQREKELSSLESDPLFQNREVMREVTDILEKDPSILGREQEPMKFAFNQALTNIGRKYAESSLTNGASPNDLRLRPPMAPPPTGKGTGVAPRGVQIGSKQEMTQEKFQKLSLAEQEKYLASRGALQ